MHPSCSVSINPLIDSFSTDISEELEHISMDDEGASAKISSSNGLLSAVVNEQYLSGSGVPDLSSFEEEDNLVQDEATLGNGYLVAQEPDDDDNDAILYTRTYDLSITYDKYYQTPRVWLFGYNERNAPLSADEMFEDIMQDYANRTVTMEPHPHRSALVHASIHPCQHGAVMKRILANLKAHGDGLKEHEIRSDQYLFLFLKFIQSVIPTIDYDHTIEVAAKQ